MIYVFERRQRLRIRAISQELADREAALANDGDWSCGDIELLDKVEEAREPEAR